MLIIEEETTTTKNNNDKTFPQRFLLDVNEKKYICIKIKTERAHLLTTLSGEMSIS